MVLEAHKKREGMTVKENVHIRVSVHGSALECPGKQLSLFQLLQLNVESHLRGNVPENFMMLLTQTRQHRTCDSGEARRLLNQLCCCTNGLDTCGFISLFSCRDTS